MAILYGITKSDINSVRYQQSKVITQLKPYIWRI